MNIEEKKRHYERVHDNRIMGVGEFRKTLKAFMEDGISMSRFVEIINEKHLAAMDAALTSLLEELPDTFDHWHVGKDAQAYRNEIKSLIKNKLK